MTLTEQHDELKRIRAAIKQAGLTKYLRVRIIHYRETYYYTDHYRAWIYITGCTDDLDSIPTIVKAQYIADMTDEQLEGWLKILAEASPIYR